MSASDRHRIHSRFEELFGAEDAGLVMEYLSPRPWDQIATKDDLRDLGDRIDDRIEAVVARSTRTIVFGMVAANATMAAAIVGGMAAVS